MKLYEGRGQKILGLLVQEFKDIGLEPIAQKLGYNAGSLNSAGSLRGNSLEPLESVKQAEILRPGELLFKRASGSNFFVFARVHGRSIDLTWYDPYTESEAWLYSHKEIVQVHSVSIFSLTVDSDIEKIKIKAQKSLSHKDEDSYFLAMHGHCGRWDGYDLQAIHMDDGKSDAVTMARNMVLYQTDYNMAFSHHNNFFRLELDENGEVLNLKSDVFDSIYNMTAEIGMETIPAVELTLPMNRAGDNGPHFLIFMADLDTASQFYKDVLSHKDSLYPPLGPKVNIWGTLNNLKHKYIAKGKMFVCLAHPACNTTLPGVGIINRIASRDIRLDIAEQKIIDFVNGVAMFNMSVPPQILKFENPSDANYFSGLLQEFNFGKELRLNSINLAYAQHLHNKSVADQRRGRDIFMFCEIDEHIWQDVRYDGSVDLLAQGHNMLILPKGMKRLTGPEVVQFLANYREDADIKFKPIIFYDRSQGYPEIVPSRRWMPFFDKLKLNIKRGWEFFRSAWYVVGDALDRVKRMTR